MSMFLPRILQSRWVKRLGLVMAAGLLWIVSTYFIYALGRWMGLKLLHVGDSRCPQEFTRVLYENTLYATGAVALTFLFILWNQQHAQSLRSLLLFIPFTAAAGFTALNVTACDQIMGAKHQVLLDFFVIFMGLVVTYHLFSLTPRSVEARVFRGMAIAMCLLGAVVFPARLALGWIATRAPGMDISLDALNVMFQAAALAVALMSVVGEKRDRGATA